MGDWFGGMRAWWRAPLLLGVLATVGGGWPSAAEAQSRARGRGASQLRQAPPEDPDEPSQGFSLPTGTFSTALTGERRVSGEGGARAGNLAATSILGVRLGLPEGLAIHAVLHLEPVENQDADAGGSRSRLSGHAAWVETLNLRWQVTIPLLLFGGKIHPRFGAAWFRVPGLYGADFAGDYELREKVGVGAELDLDALFGTPEALGGYELRVEAFGADATALSGGVFRPRYGVTGEDGATTWRRRNSRSLGGPDNAPGLPGIVASLTATGIDLPGDAAFGYSVAASWREPGQDAVMTGRARRERGAVAAVFGDVGLPLGMRLVPLVEVAGQDSAGGFAGGRAAWLTAAVTLRRDPVTVSVVEMRRRVRDTSVAAEAGWRGGRERAVNATLDLGKLTGLDWLAPVSLAVDGRRFSGGGRRVTDVAAGVLVNLSF